MKKEFSFENNRNLRKERERNANGKNGIYTLWIFN